MKKSSFTFIMFFTGLLIFNQHAFSQDDSKPWERLGLSLTEWKLITDNKLPMKKVEELLKAGIGIGEYFEKPWEIMEMQEEQWIAKRRSGMTSEEILQNERTSISPAWKQQPEENNFLEYDASKENARLFKSFFAPGFIQYQEKQKTKGTIMISIAAGSLVGCAALSVAKKQFISLPLVVVLVPDMIWSMVDYKKSKASASH